MNMKRDFRLRSRPDNNDIHDLFIYGAIGGWFSVIQTHNPLCENFEKVKSKEIHVHLNSPGGSALMVLLYTTF